MPSPNFRSELVRTLASTFGFDPPKCGIERLLRATDALEAVLPGNPQCSESLTIYSLVAFQNQMLWVLNSKKFPGI